MPIGFDIARDGFFIRPADGCSAKAARLLIPQVPEDGTRLVAIDKQRSLVIGAAGATRAMRRSRLPGPGVAIHVIEPCRRHGIGSALLAGLLPLERQRGAHAVYSTQRVEIDSNDMRAWQWLGFTAHETVEEHDLPISSIEARLGSIIERMRANGKIPTVAQVVPLHTADADSVVQLHLDHLGGDRETLLRRIRGQATYSFHPRYSLALMLNDRIVGCLLGHRQSQREYVIDAVIVDKPLRNGWANLLLKFEAARGVRHEGATHIQYTTFDHYSDTRRFTNSLGGVTLRRLALMSRAIV